MYFFNNSSCSKVSLSIYESVALPISFLRLQFNQYMHVLTPKRFEAWWHRLIMCCTKRFLSNENTLQSQKIISSQAKHRFFCITPKYRPHNVFWCFPFLSEVLFANMDNATSALLRRLFLGHSICALHSLPSARKLVSFRKLFYTIKLHLYERPYKYKRNKAFPDSP